MNKQERIQAFAIQLWSWYARHKRELPWRDIRLSNEHERAYQVLVSEIMLQQTQVERVKIVFKEFLSRFPKMKDLSQATNAEVILAWRGMGYNSRALRLRDAVKYIVEERGGNFPTDYKELIGIKGIGPYTAGAIRNFAFNAPTACIDTNIRRIIHRTFIGVENPDGRWQKSDKELLPLAEEILRAALQVPGTEHDTRNWHAALMDYGSLVCTSRSPKWNVCPLSKNGIMKTTEKSYERMMKQKEVATQHKRKEPGRYVGATYVPNRIFRGRIVEELRDEPTGLPLEEIGRRICIDWSKTEHTKWLTELVTKLKKDALLRQQEARYLLAE